MKRNLFNIAAGALLFGVGVLIDPTGSVQAAAFGYYFGVGAVGICLLIWRRRILASLNQKDTP